MKGHRAGFTLIELLVVVAIVAVLAAILFPVFSKARETAYRTRALSSTKQVLIGMALYTSDFDDKYPDRRDVKAVTTRTWASWPPSDPRSDWLVNTLFPYTKNRDIFLDGDPLRRFSNTPQVGTQSKFWMWRFDRTTDPVPDDNFWGKTSDEALTDYAKATNNPTLSPSETEIITTPYFPRTIAPVEPALKGKAATPTGRILGFMDTSAKFRRDPRLD